MSQMSNQAVLKCSQCGATVVLTHLETTQPDPDSKLLMELMRSLGKNALCPTCQARLNYNAEKERKGEQTDYVLRPARF